LLIKLWKRSSIREKKWSTCNKKLRRNDSRDTIKSSQLLKNTRKKGRRKRRKMRKRKSLKPAKSIQKKSNGKRGLILFMRRWRR